MILMVVVLALAMMVAMGNNKIQLGGRRERQRDRVRFLCECCGDNKGVGAGQGGDPG